MTRKLPPAPNWQFFKVMLPDFRSKLSIPPQTCRQLFREDLREAFLRSHAGTWRVKISGSKRGTGAICLEEGWGDFAESHRLGIGDFVVFEHRGGLAFDVKVFDASACEKDFPASFEFFASPKKKNGKTHVQTKEELHFGHCEEKVSFPPSSGRGRPYFVATMNPSNDIRYPYMNIPQGFAKSARITQVGTVTLRNREGQVWPVRVCSRNVYGKWRRFQLTQGWREFYVSNKLKNGDVCTFKVDSRADRSWGTVLDVEIVRLPSPPTN